jgi:PAS domain S-box-containing protein
MKNGTNESQFSSRKILHYLLISLVGYALITMSILTGNIHVSIILSYMVLAFIVWFCLFYYPFGSYVSLSYFLFDLIGSSIRHGHLPPPDFTKSAVYLGFAIIASIISHHFIKRDKRLNKDILDISLKEQFIRENQKNYLRLFNQLDVIVWLLDRDFRILLVNDTGCKILGLKQEDFNGKSIIDFFKCPDSVDFISSLHDAIDKSIVIKEPLRKADNSLIPTETRLGRSTWNNFEVYFAVSHDLSGRILNEEIRTRTEEKFVKVFDSTPAMMSISTYEEDTFLEANNSFTKVLGYTKEEVIGKTSKDIALFEDEDARNDIIKQLADKGIVESSEVRIRNKSGQIIRVSFSAEKVDFAGRPCILAVMVDVSDMVTLNDKLTLQTVILYGMSIAENILLTEPDYETAIYSALPVVGKALDVDLVTLCKYFADEGETLTQTWNWFQDESAHFNGIQQLLSQADNPESIEWLKTLKAGKTVSATHVLGIKSILLIPLFVDNEFWGALGFVDVIKDRAWNKGDEVTLLPLGAAIGGVISRQKTMEDLHLAKIAADNANKAKSNFLATMSHEIRTPLNGVIGMSNLMQQTELNSEQLDYVNTIRINSITLLDLINDILDFSKIESGKIDLEKQPFNLRTCVEDILDLLAVKSSEKRLELLYEITPDIRWELMGDSLRLRQILLNLVGNAVKFTKSGHIFLGIEAENVEAEVVTVKFTIRDTGVGIPEHELKNIFKPFSQADSSTSRKFGGTGLGLTISQRLIALMGGEISVESIPDTGTTFYFSIKTSFVKSNPITLPGSIPQNIPADNLVFVCISNENFRKRICGFLSSIGVKTQIIDNPDAFAERPADYPVFTTGVTDIADVVGDINQYIAKIRSYTPYRKLPLIMFRTIGVKNLANEEYYNPLNYFLTKPIKYRLLALTVHQVFNQVQTFVKDTNEAVLSKNFAKHHPHDILVVDDNMINQKLMLNILFKLGYRADVASNGLEALNTVKMNKHDFVFMDVSMPEMDGFDATRSIRHAKSVTRQPKIVAMTAHAMQGDKEKCMEAGMNDYVSKPVRFEDVLRVLQEDNEVKS